MLILDDSGSVEPETRDVENETRSFVDMLDLPVHTNTQVGVVSFTDKAQQRVRLTNDASTVKRGIRLVGTGNTDIVEGLRLGRRGLQSGRPESRKAAILVSDGQHNASSGGCNAVLSEARNFRDTALYSMCLGKDCDCMRSVADSPDHFFEASTPGELRAAYQRIAESLFIPRAGVFGTVTLNGQPIEGVRLLATGPSGWGRDDSDVHGDYAICWLPPGDYWFSVINDGIRQLSHYITIPDGGYLHHDVRLSGPASRMFVWPLEDAHGHPFGRVGSWFDHDLPNYSENGRVMLFDGNLHVASYDGHDALDLPGGGYRVVAAAAGTVEENRRSSLLGNYVKIRHTNGYYSIYAHMKDPSPVGERTPVAQRDLLGLSDSTGNVRCDDSHGPCDPAHLHFEVQTSGSIAVDPFGWDRQPTADPWYKDGAASYYLFEDYHQRPPPPPTVVPFQGQDVSRPRGVSQEDITAPYPVFRQDQIVFPEQEHVVAAGDGALTVTVGVRALGVQPVVLSTMRVSEGGPRIDGPVPRGGDPSWLPVASVLLRAFADDIVPTSQVVSGSVRVSLTAVLEDTQLRPTDRLRVIRPHDQREVPAVIERMGNLVRATWTTGELGLFRLEQERVQPTPTPTETAVATATRVIPTLPPPASPTSPPAPTLHAYYLPICRNGLP